MTKYVNLITYPIGDVKIVSSDCDHDRSHTHYAANVSTEPMLLEVCTVAERAEETHVCH